MEVVTGIVPRHLASNTGLSPSWGAGQQILHQWGAWPGLARFNSMGTYCVLVLEPGSGRDKEENPTQSSLWELMINGGDGLAVNNEAVKLG